VSSKIWRLPASNTGFPYPHREPQIEFREYDQSLKSSESNRHCAAGSETQFR
jgi:hypothetical protein